MTNLPIICMIVGHTQSESDSRRSRLSMLITVEVQLPTSDATWKVRVGKHDAHDRLSKRSQEVT